MTTLITIAVTVAILSDVLFNKSTACKALWESIKIGWGKITNGKS